MKLQKVFFFEIPVGGFFSFEIHGKRLSFEKVSDSEARALDVEDNSLKFLGIPDGVRKFHESEFVLGIKQNAHVPKSGNKKAKAETKTEVSQPAVSSKYTKKTVPCFVVCGTEFSEEMVIYSPMGHFPKMSGEFYQSILSFAFSKLKFGKLESAEDRAYIHTYLEWARRISFQVGTVHRQQSELIGYFNIQVKAPDGYFSDIRIIPGVMENTPAEPDRLSFRSLYRLEWAYDSSPVVLEGL